VQWPAQVACPRLGVERRRFGEPAEVAEVFLLLVSPRVPSMTSVEIVLDGGASPYI